MLARMLLHMIASAISINRSADSLPRRNRVCRRFHVVQDLTALVFRDFRDSQGAAIRAEHSSIEYLASAGWIKRRTVQHHFGTLAGNYLGDLRIEVVQKRIRVIEPCRHNTRA